MKSQHPSRLLSAARCLPLTAAMLFCSCSEGKPAPEAKLSVAATYNALSDALGECEDKKRECRDATDCDETDLEACEATFRECREAARPAKEAMREAASACRDTYESCKEAAGDDEAAREACRDEREVCMSATRPPKPPCHAALDECLEVARATEPALEPEAPAEPADDAGVDDPACKPHRHPRMRSAAEEACHQTAHACIETEKAAKPLVQPPKCGPKPPHLRDGGVEPPPPPAAGTNASPRGRGRGPAAGAPAPREDEHPLPPHCRGGQKPPPPPAAGAEARY